MDYLSNHIRWPKNIKIGPERVALPAATFLSTKKEKETLQMNISSAEELDSCGQYSIEKRGLNESKNKKEREKERKRKRDRE